MQSLDAILPGALLLAGLSFAARVLLVAAQVAPLPPQQMPTSPSSLPGSARSNGPANDEGNDPLMRQLSEQQAHKRNDMRQKLIVDDTAKLVGLAQQLKEDADRGSKPSPASARKAEEIERLAKAVKDKMREGQ